MKSADPQVAQRLERCLKEFRAISIMEISEYYTYHPTLASSKLGSGSYGEAFRMKSVTDSSEPARVVKTIPKLRVSCNGLQVQHLCAELAVTGFVHHQNINHRVALLHSPTTIFIVLELCEGYQPDLRTRLYHLFSKYDYTRIKDVETLARAWEGEAADQTANKGAFFDEKVNAVCRECNVRKECPLGSDVFNAIVLHKRIPEVKAAIILKQVLEGVAFLHASNIVHRDIKTENLVMSETRNATPLTDKSTGAIIGIRIHETISVKLIDFGLVKYMKLSHFPNTPSPGVFTTSSDPFQSSGDPFATSLHEEEAAKLTPLIEEVAVTPCGTEVYCSLEVLSGIVEGGCGTSKWMSTTGSLPKFDVYGVGTVLYCMTNGRPPFRIPQTYRQITREEKVRQVMRLVEQGVQFVPQCSETCRAFILKLMAKEPALRPTAADALRDPYFSTVGNTFVYDVMCDGSFVVQSCGSSNSQSIENSVVGLCGEKKVEEQDDGDEEDSVELVMEALRQQEDKGDGQGKRAQ